MLSAITTSESVEELSKRLSAWCIIEVTGQRFNFRFPDTRRLPAIYETLTTQQAAEMCGNAIEWRYIDRDGEWKQLQLEPTFGSPGVTANAELDEQQFAYLIDDSALDELWVQLEYQGVKSRFLPSQRHSTLSTAIQLAKRAGLDEDYQMEWCSKCVAWGKFEIEKIPGRFEVWMLQNMGKKDEKKSATI